MMNQFDDFFLEVVKLANATDLRYGHFWLEHKAYELPLSEKNHHRTLQHIDFLEEQHDVQLSNHLFPSLVKKLYILPITPHLEHLQQHIERLNEVVKDIILSKVSWASFLRSIQGLCKVHLVRMLIVEVYHQ